MAKKEIRYHETSYFVSLREDPRCGGQYASRMVKEMRCSNCHTKVSASARFCPSCGQQFSGKEDSYASGMKKEIAKEKRKLTAMKKKITCYDKKAVSEIEKQEKLVDEMQLKLWNYEFIPVES